MNKATFGTSLVLFALAGSAWAAAASAGSSCLQCHGSVDAMKALVRPPVAGPAESGEG